MRKPLELKSPDNAMALACWLLTTVLGASFAIGQASSPGLVIMLGPFLAPYGLLMMLSGGVGLTAAVSCSRSSKPSRWLTAECVASIVFACVWALYSVASQLAPNATKVGLILFGLMAVAGGWRAVQIMVELFRLRLAEVKPVRIVTVESLADPRDIT